MDDMEWIRCSTQITQKAEQGHWDDEYSRESRALYEPNLLSIWLIHNHGVKNQKNGYCNDS
jgi:hypothetical protein